MTKHLPLIALTSVMLAACGGSDKNTSDKAGQAGNQNVLRIYNWSEYVDPETVADFEKKNGIKVTYDVYDSDETLESKVLTGKSGYDIVGPSNTFVGRQIKAGAYQKIDKSLIPNYKNLNPELMKLMEGVDPSHEYAVPFYWGTNTFAINTERVKKALGTDKLPDNQWDLVFNPEYTSKLKQCGISYLDSAAEIYPMVLNYMGKNPNSNDTEDIKAATELLKKNRPNIKRFTSSGFIDDLARGDTCVTIGFGGDLNIARRRAEEAGGKEKIRVMMPKEGVDLGGLLRYPKRCEKRRQRPQIHQRLPRPRSRREKRQFRHLRPFQQTRARIDGSRIQGRPYHFPERRRFEKQLHHGSHPTRHFKIHGSPMAGRKSGQIT